MPQPFADMGCVLSELGAPSAISVRRFAAGGYDATGRYQSPASALTPTRAVVNPATPREIEKLPENERTSESITVFTSALLQTSDVASQAKADQVVWAGKTYEVKRTQDWTRQAGYAWALAVRVGV